VESTGGGGVNGGGRGNGGGEKKRRCHQSFTAVPGRSPKVAFASAAFRQQYRLCAQAREACWRTTFSPVKDIMYGDPQPSNNDRGLGSVLEMSENLIHGPQQGPTYRDLL